MRLVGSAAQLHMSRRCVTQSVKARCSSGEVEGWGEQFRGPKPKHRTWAEVPVETWAALLAVLLSGSLRGLLIAYTALTGENEVPGT